MIRGFVLSAVLLSAASASADANYPAPLPPPNAPLLVPEPPLAPPSFVQPVMVPMPMPMPMPDPEQGPKSPGTAVMLSLAATIAPPLIAASIYGDEHYVGNDHDEEMLWIFAGSALIGPSIGHWYAGKVMTPGLGVRALGFALGAAAFGTDDLGEGLGLLMLGSTAILGGAIYDIATAGRSAREYNFEHATRTIPMVVPTVGPDGHAQLRVGLTGNF